MRNTKSLALSFFDKSKKLHMTNKIYRDCVYNLFSWILKNDQITNDITTKLLLSKKTVRRITATIVSRNNAVIAGIEEIIYFLDTFTHLKFKTLKQDGDFVIAGESIMEISGKPEEILIYERTILNILQRLTGIASETHKNISHIQSLKLVKEPYIAATRKTVWSLLDKKAVSIGGGLTHRLTLADGILVKDNHLLILKKEYHLKTEEDVTVKTLMLLLQKVNKTLIEIEVEKKESVSSLIKVFNSSQRDNILGILLDNFTPQTAREVLDGLDGYNLDNIVFEASGGINSENLSLWVRSGVDIISLGALTHSVKAADIGLDM